MTEGDSRPSRDYRGYGANPPQVRWPGSARLAVSLVVNVEEGAELSLGHGDELNEHVYEAVAAGSREFEHGHTWDGAPQSCAVGLEVLDELVERRLVEHVAGRGPRFLDELASALAGIDIVGEVRGRGFLLGVDLVDPRDGESFLPDELNVAALVDRTALGNGLLVTSSHSTADGFAGDATLLAPAFTSTDEELAEMCSRLAGTLAEVESQVKSALSG